MLDKILLDDGAGGYGPFSGWMYSRFCYYVLPGSPSG